jgi:type IV secretion system protein VirD4
MVPTLPTLPVPWYTTLTVITLVLMALYLWWTVFKIVLFGVIWTLTSAGRTFTNCLSAIFGTQLSSHGTARWATIWDRKRAQLDQPGHIALGRVGRTIIREPNGGHIALFGPPRSRKSWGCIMPAITDFPGSVVVSDMRAELHQHTSALREQIGMVHRFDPAGSESISMNLLDNIRWGSTFAHGDVDRIVHHLLLSSGDNDAGQAIPLLRGLLWYAHTEGWGDFPSILGFMTDASRSLKEKLQLLLACPLRVVQAGARSTLDLSDKSRQWAWMKAREPLDIFDDELIASRTRTSNVLLHDLLDAVEVQTLYLCMGFSDIWRLNVFLGAFCEMLCALVSAPERVRRHALALILDEAANLGAVRELERGVSYLQGSGCQVLMTFQNMQQVQNHYGPDTPLIASCANIVHYVPTPGDMLTATAISNLLGPTTTIAWGATSVTTSGLFGSSSETRRQSVVARPLLFPREVLELDADTALVFIQHQPPCLCDKLGMTTRTTAARVQRVIAGQIPLVKTCAATALLLFTLWPLRPYLGTSPTTVAATSPLLGTLTPAVQTTPTPAVQTIPTPTGEPNVLSSTTPVPPPWQTRLREQSEGPWKLRVTMPGIGEESIVGVQRTFKVREECLSALGPHRAAMKREAGNGSTIVIETDSATSVRWRERWMSGPEKTYGATCEESTTTTKAGE